MSDFISNIMNSLWSSHFVFKALADGLVVLIVLRVLLHTYREHTYLYHAGSREILYARWIEFLAPWFRVLELRKYRTFLSLHMSRANFRKDYDTNHFLASQLVPAIITMACAYLLLVLVLNLSIAFVLALGAIAFAIPAIRLHDISSRRFKSCNRDLPFFIDYMALAMGAGLDFNKSLDRVVADAPQSPLSDEFKNIQRNLHLGMSRADALLELENRMQSPVIKLFVQTMVQALEMGTDVAQTLSVISETLSQKRFQLAEEMAGNISVRMMIPMMRFVMPSVLIVLLGPMVLSYLQTF